MRDVGNRFNNEHFFYFVPRVLFLPTHPFEGKVVTSEVGSVGGGQSCERKNQLAKIPNLTNGE